MQRYRSAHIVVGCHYGDEGKGRVVSHLCRNLAKSPVVIRYSGGAQAGHTVVSGGKRHVFHHIGSGTFEGAPTFLSEFFACDPVYFNREWVELGEVLSSPPEVWVDPRSPIVTPFDVLVNQSKELQRYHAKSVPGQKYKAHGSCGFGVGEAFRRQEETTRHLIVDDLTAPPSILKSRLDEIAQEAVDWMARSGFSLVQSDLDRCYSDFMGSIPAFLSRVRISTWENLFDWTRLGRPTAVRQDLIFEGSQGLLLDRDIGAFPHVTRAKTGLLRPYEMMARLKETQMLVEHQFVTRAYVTRHGEGPLDGEDSTLDYCKRYDATNVPNPWQGAIRHAPLTSDRLAWAINRAKLEVSAFASPNGEYLNVTCLDQVTEEEHERVMQEVDEVLERRCVHEAKMFYSANTDVGVGEHVLEVP